MDRLTKLFCETTCSNGIKERQFLLPEFSGDVEHQQKMADKLGMLEDLEEELGCPLDLVIKPFYISGLKRVWYHKKWCDVVRVVAYEEATRPYMEVRCDDYKYLKMIFLDDYKNTWWLKKDMSE